MIKQALDAMDKATAGPWGVDRKYCTKAKSKDIVVSESWMIKTIDETRANTVLIAAAPDMAAWIEKALPWLEAYAETMRDSLQDWDRNNVARLDALIQEATE
jgi:hypothetical protein